MLSLEYWNIIFTIINIIVLFLILKKFLYKPIIGMMEKRKQAIDSSIENAEKKEADALILQQKFESELELSKNKADEIINHAKIKAQNEYDRILSEAKLEADSVISAAQRSIEMQRKKEFEKMQESIVDIAIAVAIKATEDSIDKEKSKKMLEELVMKAGA